jgi:hypothetical protein
MDELEEIRVMLHCATIETKDHDDFVDKLFAEIQRYERFAFLENQLKSRLSGLGASNG